MQRSTYKDGRNQTYAYPTRFKRSSKPGSRKDHAAGSLSSATIAYIYRVLKNIFNRSKDWKIINDNPMDGIKKPKVIQQKVKFYDEIEATTVITLLYEAPPMRRLFCIGAILGGFRRGEILALEWPEVNFTKKSIAINKSISLTIDGQPVIKVPKTELLGGEWKQIVAISA